MKCINVVVPLLVLLLLNIILLCESKSIPYSRNLNLPTQEQIDQFYYKNVETQKEYIRLRQNQYKPLELSNLNGNYPVSTNCSNAMNNILNVANPSPNIEMVLYSGVGFNELGNYDSCLNLPSNTSQYCLFNGNIEKILPMYIGVCYPSAEVCSPDDVLGLMTQYSILSILQFEMNFTASENLVCYNSTYQTVKIEASTGTWVITGICVFIGLSVIIGTLVEYIFIYKLSQHRRKFGALINNPYSLLNPKSYFESNSTNLQDHYASEISGDSNTLGSKNGSGNSGSSGVVGEFKPKFYDSFFERLSNSFGTEEMVNDNLLIRYLMCWSLIKNYKSLVYGASNKHYFNSLDGIRCLSMCWVILGHSLLFGTSGFGYDNLAYLATGPVTKSFSFQVVPAGEFAVDTFFMLSGFLVAYSVITTLNKYKGGSVYGSIKFWSVYVIHRFIRLSPLYYFLIFAAMWVIPMMGSGPLFYEYKSYDAACTQNWWTNLLYINNLYSTMGNECFAWAWYLANDMQFFLLTPFIIILFKKWKLGAWLLVVSMILASLIGTTIASYKYQLTPFFDMLSAQSVFSNTASQYLTDIYQKPYNRIGPYLVGILISFIYTAPRLSKTIRYIYHFRLARYVLYAVAFFITFFLSYIPYNFYQQTNGWTNAQNAVFSGFAHTMFTVGLGIFMLATFYGYGGAVKWFLELGVFKFFSKLTYSSYLVHPLVITYRIYSMTTFLHYSTTEFIVFYIGNLATTFAVAFTIHLLIEKPFINLERLLFSPSSK